MEGDEGLLSTGSLNYDFGRSEQKLKKSLHLQALATGIWMFRDPDLSRFWPRFGVIFEKRCENVTIRQSAVSGGRMGTDRRVWSGVGANSLNSQGWLLNPRGTAGIITRCARNLRSGNVIVFGWPDPTHPIVGVPDQHYVQEFIPGCKEVLRTPALQGVI